MAAFIRSKQAGISRDLSEGILPGLFAPDDRFRIGINSQISVLAYDPTQSLLAVGTSETTFGSGQIYIFGQERVKVILTLPRKASIRILQFCADRLISVDSKNEIIVWDLALAKKISSYAPPGVVTGLVTDPMLDWALIGLQNGEVICYDLDRERRAPLRLPNYWQQRSPNSRILPIVAMALHPRDIGKLLIAYSEGAVVYSFKLNAPTKFFRYEIPAGAAGGNSDPVTLNTVRRPRLVDALWHPSGTFLLTVHEEGSLVFWDANDGRVLMARTIKDTHVDKPGSAENIMSFKEPYAKIKWMCKSNSDDSALLIAGGQPLSMAGQGLGLSMLDFGVAPLYATSSWKILSDHFEGKSMHHLRTPPGVDITNYCLIPRASPHYAGAQDPIAVVCVLSTGELTTLSIPTGHPISPTNMLHPSLALMHPFMTMFAVADVERDRWLGMVETRTQGPKFVLGGVHAPKPLKRYMSRNILMVASGDGTVRFNDIGHDDEIENHKTLQIDVARAVGRTDQIDIKQLNMSSTTGEVAVGTVRGEIVMYRWSTNRSFGRESTPVPEAKPGGIVDISGRSEPTLKEGLSPFVLYNMAQGAVSALKISDVGFIGMGSENGTFSIMDLRGPAIIFSGSINDLAKHDKRSHLFRKSSVAGSHSTDTWPCKIEFGVMTLEGDEYSSICCFVGTTGGQVATFKILPQPNGSYTAQFAGSVACHGKVVALCPIKDSGKPAFATGQALGGLREGQLTSGSLVVVTDTEARIFKPASAKGASRSWENAFCDAAAVTHFENHGYALVGVFNNTARAYSIPALKELGNAALPMLDRTRVSLSVVTPAGDIFGYTGPSELALLHVWGTGQPLNQSADKLFNPLAHIPPRPTISNLQWIAGTQYMSPLDLDLLIGGPDRPPSKRMMAAAAAEERERRLGSAGTGGSRANASQEGWGEYMTRQLNERTERLNIMGDSMDKMQENSAGWAEDASKWASKQKRNILFGGIKKGIGL